MWRKSLILIVLVLTYSCSVEVDNKNTPEVSNSIFGEYTTNITTTSSYFLNGTTITVSKINSTYIKISTQEYLSRFEFDSVKLVGSDSFAISQVVKHQYSATGYANSTGSGKFGIKTISMNVILKLDSSLKENFTIINARKVKD